MSFWLRHLHRLRPAQSRRLVRVFFRPGGSGAGAVDGGIDAPQVALDEATLIQEQPQGVEDLGPGAVLAPAVEAVVDGLPGAVAFGRVRPGGAGVQVPEDAVDQRAVVLPRVPCLAVVVALREERLDPLPLRVGKIKAVHGGLLRETAHLARWSLPL